MKTSIQSLRNQARFRVWLQDKLTSLEATRLNFHYDRKARRDLAHDTRIFIRDLRRELKRNLEWGNIILPDCGNYRDIWRFNTDSRFASSDIAYIHSKLQKAFPNIDSTYLSIRFCKSWWEDFNNNYHYNWGYLTRMPDEVHIVQFNLSDTKQNKVIVYKVK